MRKWWISRSENKDAVAIFVVEHRDRTSWYLTDTGQWIEYHAYDVIEPAVIILGILGGEVADTLVHGERRE